MIAPSSCSLRSHYRLESVFSFLLLALFTMLSQAFGQYQWTNFVGLPGGWGNVDGTGTAARFYGPSGMAKDASGTIFVADSSNHAIRKITPAGAVTTLAGGRDVGGLAEGYVDATGSAARFAYPEGVAVDASGNVYVADMNNHAIRKITPAGVVTTLAGGSGSGSSDGTGTAAKFHAPQGIAMDGSGNLYVADTLNNTIRKVTPAGVVTTLAGTASVSGSANGTGAAARFSGPTGIVFDASSGNLYVGDQGNGTIRQVTLAGVVTTFAGSAGSRATLDGTGSAARINTPSGMTSDSAGNLYFVDGTDNVLRKITPAAVVTTLAGSAGVSGTADGTGTSAEFAGPSGVVADAGSNLYVSDYANNTIRKVTSTGVVTTIAGEPDHLGSDDGTGTAARFNYPLGVRLDNAGNLYVADGQNNTIRKVTPEGVVTTLAGSAGEAGLVDGTGSAARFGLPTDMAVDSSGNLFLTEGNSTVRKITSAGVVTTIAGAPFSGYVNGTGSAVRFFAPNGIVMNSAGDLFVVDNGNNAIRKVTQAGVVTTFAGSLTGSQGGTDGTGTAALFNGPYGVAIDGSDNLYVTDAGGSTIRKITPAAVVTTIAGSYYDFDTVDGTGSAARFAGATGISCDGSGNLYLVEISNTVRKVTPSGVVTTIGGTPGVTGGADGIGPAAQFSFDFVAGAITSSPSGTLYVSDHANQRIVKGSIASATPTVTTPTSTSITGTGATLGGNVTSDGGATITERGVVYSVTSTNSNPQISGTGVSQVSTTGTTGVFTVSSGALTPGTAYSFAAYATNSSGTSYSSVGTFTTPAPADYTITTSGGVLTITDVSGHGDTLALSAPSAGSILLAASGRVFSVNGASGTTGDSGSVSLSGITSIVVNAGDGNDVINVGAFTAMPSLTINGGKGNDTVNFNGNIDFALNASLNADLQDDDATPGTDSILIADNVTLTLPAASTGTVTLKASKQVVLGNASSLIAATGGVLIEANQQTTPSSGDFSGVVLGDLTEYQNLNLAYQGATIHTTGAGSIVIRGRGGDAGAASTVWNCGVYSIRADVSALGSGSVTISGTSGTGGTKSSGIMMMDGNFTAHGGNVALTGNAICTVEEVFQVGVWLQTAYEGGTISTSGSGTVNLTGTGAPSSGGAHAGIMLGIYSTLSTVNGDLTLTGTGGQGGPTAVGTSRSGVSLDNPTIKTTGTGNIVITGIGGTANSTAGNYAVEASANALTPGTAEITTTAGDVTITGTPGVDTGYAVLLDASGGNLIDTSAGSGKVFVIADSIGLLDFTGQKVAITGPGSSVTLKPKTAGFGIALGTDSTPGAGGALGFTTDSLNVLSTPSLTIGDSTSGDIQFLNPTSINSTTNVSLVTGGSIYSYAGPFYTSGGNVRLTTGTTGKVYFQSSDPEFDLTAPSTGTLSFASGTKLAFTFFDGVTYDTLNVNGRIDLTGTTLVLEDASSGTYTPSAGQGFTLISNDNADAVTSTFTGLAEGSTVSVNGVNKKLTYIGGTGNDVVLLPIVSLSSNANLSALTLSSGTLSPTFASGTISYSVTLPRSVATMTVTPTVAESHATIQARVNGGSYSSVTSGNASSSLALNLGANTIEVLVTAQDGTTTKTYTVSVTRRTFLEAWRNQYFSTFANTGNAADTATPQNDGLPNLLKFALGMNPTVSGVPAFGIVKNGSNLEFTYPRSVEAVAECTFIVEWSDTLLAGSWVATGVTENVLSDNGTLQQVKAAIPASGVDRRFVRLRVTNP